jgi:phosphoribosylamine--glycine ligase
VCVVLASEGYPRGYSTGFPIEGLESADSVSDVKVFHAGTRYEGGVWLTNGGRVMGVTARGPSVEQARERAYDVIRRVNFKGAHYRTDIALRGAGA